MPCGSQSLAWSWGAWATQMECWDGMTGKERRSEGKCQRQTAILLGASCHGPVYPTLITLWKGIYSPSPPPPATLPPCLPFTYEQRGKTAVRHSFIQGKLEIRIFFPDYVISLCFPIQIKIRLSKCFRATFHWHKPLILEREVNHLHSSFGDILFCQIFFGGILWFYGKLWSECRGGDRCRGEVAEKGFVPTSPCAMWSGVWGANHYTRLQHSAITADAES